MNISSFRIKRRKKSEQDVEEKQGSNIEDLLEMVAPIDKFKTKPVLGVTTFSRQMWCEKSLEICLEKNIRITSKAMEEGIKHHEELELEDHQVISVMVENEYEKIAVEMLSMLNLLDGLVERGHIRELPIIGFYKGIMLRGIIDSLMLKPNPRPSGFGETSNVKYAPEKIRDFTVLITDTKTRRNQTLPSNVQQKTTVLQLGLYRKILGEMIYSGRAWRARHTDLVSSAEIKAYVRSSPSVDLSDCCSGCRFLSHIFGFHGLDPSISFSEFRELEDGGGGRRKRREAEDPSESGVHTEPEDTLGKRETEIETDTKTETETETETDGQSGSHSEVESDVDAYGEGVLRDYESALELGFNLLLSLSVLPEIQPEMKVEYDCQGKTFATKWYKSPEQTVELELDYLLGWWLGSRESESVRTSEAWKCKYCNVIEYCQACPLAQEERERCIEQVRQNELESLLLKDLEESSSSELIPA